MCPPLLLAAPTKPSHDLARSTLLSAPYPLLDALDCNELLGRCAIKPVSARIPPGTLHIVGLLYSSSFEVRGRGDPAEACLMRCALLWGGSGNSIEQACSCDELEPPRLFPPWLHDAGRHQEDYRSDDPQLRALSTSHEPDGVVRASRDGKEAGGWAAIQALADPASCSEQPMVPVARPSVPHLLSPLWRKTSALCAQAGH